MSAMTITWRRTIGMARGFYSTALAIGGFLAASAVLFAFNLESAEGGRMLISSIWAVSVSPVLPVLAAFLAMDVWSSERSSGRIEILLSTPVSEWDYVLGKYLGVFTMTMLTIVLSAIVSCLELNHFAPIALSSSRVIDFFPAFFALALQGALWSAVSVAMSAFFCHAAAAACASLTVLVALPRVAWVAMTKWYNSGNVGFGEMPFDAHVLDMSSGMFRCGTIVSYLLATALMLFVSLKSIQYIRFKGKGSFSARFSTVLTILLACVLCAMSVVLALRLNFVVDIPLSGESRFSSRTKSVLTEARGDITITAFMSRRETKFREISQLMRALKAEADALGGLRLTLRYVDPTWDIGASERLVRAGAKEASVVFESSRSFVELPLIGGVDERRAASAIMRLTTPVQRRTVYWTIGHGEFSLIDYGHWGMSDISHDLARDGYRCRELDLATEATVPSDCAVVVIAGAKTDFSAIESKRIDAYLKQGGRVLVMMDNPKEGGINSLLPQWGVNAARANFTDVRTLSGSDVIVSDFSDHVAANLLKGTQLILERPLVFTASAATTLSNAADALEFSSIASVGGRTVVASVERGAMLGEDLAIRPTRLVVIGDPSFVLNGQLRLRQNANRDFFLNVVSFLSGIDAVTGSGREWNQLSTGFDRHSRVIFTLAGSFLIPSAIFLFLVLVVFRRRHRQ